MPITRKGFENGHNDRDIDVRKILKEDQDHAYSFKEIYERINNSEATLYSILNWMINRGEIATKFMDGEFYYIWDENSK